MWEAIHTPSTSNSLHFDGWQIPKKKPPVPHFEGRQTQKKPTIHALRWPTQPQKTKTYRKIKGDNGKRGGLEHIHLVEHMGAHQRVKVLEPTVALIPGSGVLHRFATTKWRNQGSGYQKGKALWGRREERMWSLSEHAAIYNAVLWRLDCTLAAGSPRIRVTRVSAWILAAFALKKS